MLFRCMCLCLLGTLLFSSGSEFSMFIKYISCYIYQYSVKAGMNMKIPIPSFWEFVHHFGYLSVDAGNVGSFVTWCP